MKSLALERKKERKKKKKKRKKLAISGIPRGVRSRVSTENGSSLNSRQLHGEREGVMELRRGRKERSGTETDNSRMVEEEGPRAGRGEKRNRDAAP